MKRIFDLFFSLALLLLLLPMLIFFGLIISVTSKGGIFFKQQRVGKDQQPFWLIKFRTMHPDSEKFGLITVGDRDPRVTAVGKFLRKTKLDELPQIINILKGEMSFVGPRPEVPKYISYYEEQYLEILKVRPGLTDLASLQYIEESRLLGESHDPERTYIEEVLPAKLDLQLRYVLDNSLALDVKILIQTALKILRTLVG